jgi:hypothetical protein
MLAPCLTGGIRCGASPSSVTPCVDDQVRPTGRVVIDHGRILSSQPAINAVNRASQPVNKSINRSRVAAGLSNGIPLVTSNRVSSPPRQGQVADELSTATTVRADRPAAAANSIASELLPSSSSASPTSTTIRAPMP